MSQSNSHGQIGDETELRRKTSSDSGGSSGSNRDSRNDEDKCSNIQNNLIADDENDAEFLRLLDDLDIPEPNTTGPQQDDPPSLGAHSCSSTFFDEPVTSNVEIALNANFDLSRIDSDDVSHLQLNRNTLIRRRSISPKYSKLAPNLKTQGTRKAQQLKPVEAEAEDYQKGDNKSNHVDAESAASTRTRRRKTKTSELWINHPIQVSKRQRVDSIHEQTVDSTVHQRTLKRLPVSMENSKETDQVVHLGPPMPPCFSHDPQDCTVDLSSSTLMASMAISQAAERSTIVAANDSFWSSGADAVSTQYEMQQPNVYASHPSTLETSQSFVPPFPSRELHYLQRTSRRESDVSYAASVASTSIASVLSEPMSAASTPSTPVSWVHGYPASPTTNTRRLAMLAPPGSVARRQQVWQLIQLEMQQLRMEQEQMTQVHQQPVLLQPRPDEANSYPLQHRQYHPQQEEKQSPGFYNQQYHHRRWGWEHDNM